MRTRLIADEFSAEERAIVEHFDAAPDAEESLRWRVAVAINDEGAYCGECDYEDGLDCPRCRKDCLGYADAAIAVACAPVDGAR